MPANAKTRGTFPAQHTAVRRRSAAQRAPDRLRQRRTFPARRVQPSLRFISETTRLSMREICTCETPTTFATSLCVMSRK